MHEFCNFEAYYGRKIKLSLSENTANILIPNLLNFVTVNATELRFS